MDEWQPIRTAPSDVSILLLFPRRLVRRLASDPNNRVYIGYRSAFMNYYAPEDRGAQRRQYPTHWMSLQLPADVPGQQPRAAGLEKEK